MSLTSRISVAGAPAESAEDILSASLSTIFPDDVANLHGETGRDLVYTSPHLPAPLRLSLADPDGEDDRRLFSQYLWNSSLLLAELIEDGTLGPPAVAGRATVRPGAGGAVEGSLQAAAGRAGSGIGGGGNLSFSFPSSHFDVVGFASIELGAGAALPSLLAALLGAKHVVITDYPSPVVVSNLQENVRRCLQPASSPLAAVASVVVEGHVWGDLSTEFARGQRHAFDRVVACDCLWMTGQHDNLRRSITWFLKPGRGARCWVVAGFHTGRAAMRGFFDEAALATAGLEVERIWERDCDGVERPWRYDRGIEDISERKRWLAVGVLRRTATVGAEEDAAFGP